MDLINVTLPSLPFSQKTEKKIFWRGTTTGLWHSKKLAWRLAQRERLSLLANDFEGHANVLVPVRGGMAIERQILGSEVANERWLDVGFSSLPSQCDKTDGTVSTIGDLTRVRSWGMGWLTFFDVRACSARRWRRSSSSGIELSRIRRQSIGT